MSLPEDHILRQPHPAGRPRILAHRGLVTEQQENTLPAIKAAMASPHCDGCEFDVFLTRDGQVVVFHDESLQRLTGLDRNIVDMDWSELKHIPIQQDIEVDGGLRHYPTAGRIPLLSEVLELVRDRQDFLLDIELKAYMPKWSRRKTGTAVAKVVRAMGAERQVVCTSFDFFMLACLEREYAGLASGFAYDDDMPLKKRWLNWLMEHNLVGWLVHSDVKAVEYTLLDEDSIARHHRRHMAVGSFTLFPLTPPGQEDRYTEQHGREARRLAALGVDWLETDDPARLHHALQGHTA